MQNNVIKFTSFEREIIEDTRFLPARRELMAKIEALFSVLQQRLEQKNVVQKMNRQFPDIPFQSAKISKGDNYLSLPYVVLDYPRYYEKENILSCRSMFWWGNFYSFTLHIQGEPWKQLRHKLRLPASLLSVPAYLFIGTDPWSYHFGPENYVLIEKQNVEVLEELMRQKDFLKISRKIPISSSPEDIVESGVSAFSDFLSAFIIPGL